MPESSITGDRYPGQEEKVVIPFSAMNLRRAFPLPDIFSLHLGLFSFFFFFNHSSYFKNKADQSGLF